MSYGLYNTHDIFKIDKNDSNLIPSLKGESVQRHETRERVEGTET